MRRLGRLSIEVGREIVWRLRYVMMIKIMVRSVMPRLWRKKLKILLKKCKF